jgi:hypothetical protein
MNERLYDVTECCVGCIVPYNLQICGTKIMAPSVGKGLMISWVIRQNRMGLFI